MNDAQTIDVAGVGVGPFNLSLAALLDFVPEVRSRFFDAKPRFEWHPGLLFDFATLQSPYLKDLVTLVDPTSPFTFLNYLVREGRIHRFVVSDYKNVPRREFERYFQWVARQLPNVQFSTPVDDVDFDGSAFVVRALGMRQKAQHLALGVGRVPNIPSQANAHLGTTVFHATEYLQRMLSKRGKRILIIGGGQSGAEIFYDLIRNPRDRPDRVTWVTRRHNFVPFDESPFANELYAPGYTSRFFHFDREQREVLLAKQKYSSDGIVESLLRDIYRTLYEMDYLADASRVPYRLLVDRELAALEPMRTGWTVVTHGPGARETIQADTVILATGFRFTFPRVLEPLRDLIAVDDRGNFVVNEDFSIVWDGPPQNRIYVHNAALHTHGWIDPNFAGMAWRSAVMINSIVGRQVFDVRDERTTVDWAGDTLPLAAQSEEPYELLPAWPVAVGD